MNSFWRINANDVKRTRIAHVLGYFTCLIILSAWSCFAETCDNGATVDNKAQCEFFYVYNKGDENNETYPIIAPRLGLAKNTPARSIAIVVGVSSYPNMLDPKDQTLPAAARDVTLLKEFLKTSQKFDEIIVLENEKATKTDIEYFMRAYARSQALKYKGHSRFLFAFSGHGVARAQSAKGYLELTATWSNVDFQNLIEFNELKVWLEDLASSNFHVLALINACYGGGIFTVEHADNALNNTYERGAHAMTAGPSDSLVYALPGVDEEGQPNGSIFFENLIKGVKSGEADTYSRDNPEIVGDGDFRQIGSGIVRLGALDVWLANSVDDINRARPEGNPDTHQRFAYPRLGSVEPVDIEDPGAFFFLQPLRVSIRQPSVLPTSPGAPIGPFGAACKQADNGNPCSCNVSGKDCGVCSNGICALPVPIALPRGPTSFVPGAPNLKVFDAASSYPIHGVDVSRFEGEIDWKELKKNVGFVYLRAMVGGLDSKAGPEGLDPRFKEHWGEAKEVGLPRGAYNVFGYCDSVTNQFEAISRAVPVDEDALPIALDIERYPESWTGANKEAQCAAHLDAQEKRKRVLQLASLLKQHYKKTPLILGVGSVLSGLLDERFSQYMIWIASYPRNGTTSSPDLGLTGGNPWTLWQVSANSKVPGIGDNVNVNVFFGSSEQFAEFRGGAGNLALGVSAASDDALNDIISLTQNMMLSMSQNCSGGANGVPPVNWASLNQRGNSVVKKIGDLRVALSKGQTTNAVQQINTIDAELDSIVSGVHNNCSGGSHGIDPLNYGIYQQTVTSVKSRLEGVKQLFGG